MGEIERFVREKLEDSGAEFPSDEAKEAFVSRISRFGEVLDFPHEDAYLASVMRSR